jgi:hypothetical protein
VGFAQEEGGRLSRRAERHKPAAEPISRKLTLL